MILTFMDLVAGGNSLTYLDIIMIFVLIFSGYTLISEGGLKKGGLYLLVLLGAGAMLGLISEYFNSTGKYLSIFIILIVGLVWHYKKKDKEG